jgi:hypothetical protein
LFIYYYVHVPGSVDEVVQALGDRPGEMTAWATLAYEGSDELRARVYPGLGMPTREVEVVVGRVTRRQSAVHIPISWKASGSAFLFPTLEADLIVEAVGDGLTQVTIRGSYEPPLGPVGRFLDRALLHRLAEACVKNFMDRLGDAITVAAPGDPIPTT